MRFSQQLVIILFPYAIKIFKKVLKKAGLPYGAESYVEIKGFLARHYDTLLDLATVGFYKNFMKDVISKMNIQPNDMILDMGAGTGRNDLLMLGYLEEGKVIGLEIGEEMKKQFQEKSYYHDNLKLIELRIERDLPFEDEFDEVFISFTLHGFEQEDRIKIIENANKALKKRGKFFILDYNEFDLSNEPFYIKVLFRLECDLASDYIKRDWKNTLKERGFSVQNEHLYLKNLIRLLELKKY
jgi:ubiquinone/menaquinone biosynthesis C-methylase UbiE